MAQKQLPSVANLTDVAAFIGGLDLISPPGSAKPGTARFASNYEAEFGGGYRRLGGFERIDGRPSPHQAAYTALEAAAGYVGVVVGNTLVGATSLATGTVVYVTATFIGMTKVTGTFINENVRVAAVVVGAVTQTQPIIDGFLDNQLSELAANVYRADILKPPGTGPIRGIAVLNDIKYCWKDNAGNLVTYKSTAGGWVVVPMFSQVSFNGGSVSYEDGESLTQGAASATIMRVVLETGSWAAGTAAGRLVINPVAGSFAAGVAGGGGVANLAGPAAVITLFAGGKVDSVVYNFTANLATKRLYCCDGVNIEWEFDGTILVPIKTGMTGFRATRVIAHKNHLFYSFRSSLQHSRTGLPYEWSAVLGAGELGAGDTITNMIGVSGSESSAALMVICQNSVWMLYGTDVTTWQFSRISEEAGAQAYSAQAIAGTLAFDLEGFNRFRPMQSFGNFSYESVSRGIDPLVRNATVKCSVLVKNKSIYRCFFSDGLFATGTFNGKTFSWMPCDYGVVIECAVGAEINGLYRVFYGSADGWVYEADVGRSFDGAEVEAALRMSSQHQNSPLTTKQYRHAEVQIQAESAFQIALAGEFDDSDPNLAGVTATQLTSGLRKVYGAGLFYDFESWDRAYWDGALSNRLRFPIHGVGRSMSLLLRSLSTNELPHTLKLSQLIYTPRRIAR